jgi:hypothetical protein
MTNHTEDELEQLKDELKKAEKERDKYKEGFLIVCRWIDRNSKYEKGISFIDGKQVSVPQRLEKRLRAKKCLTMTRDHDK